MQKGKIMKGVNYVTDEKNRKVAVQINLNLLDNYQQKLEDLLDIIVAESRKDDDEITIEEVEKRINKKSKRK